MSEEIKTPEDKIFDLNWNNDVFRDSISMDTSRDEFSSNNLKTKDKGVYDQMEKYLIENKGNPTLHDYAKYTLAAKDADEVLKIYRDKDLYDKEKEAYKTLKNKGVNLDNFVKQWGWDDKALTARAQTLDTCKINNRSKVMHDILTNLSEKDLFLNDLNRKDNIGTIKGRPVVFDVKSLVDYKDRAYEIPPYEKDDYDSKDDGT